jgi:hypothetical protein
VNDKDSKLLWEKYQMLLEISENIFMRELLKRGFKYEPNKGNYMFDARDTGHKFVKFIEVIMYYSSEGEEKIIVSALTRDVQPNDIMFTDLEIDQRVQDAQDKFSEILKIIDELLSGTFEIPEGKWDLPGAGPEDPADWWKK